MKPGKRMPQRRVLRFEGGQTAGLNALTTEDYVQAKGRLEAAARDLEGFKSLRVLSV